MPSISDLLGKKFETQSFFHADAILLHKFPHIIKSLKRILAGLHVDIDELVVGGGGESRMTVRFRKAFEGEKWKKRKFEIETTLDQEPVVTRTHEVDHVMETRDALSKKAAVVALEIEWNSKNTSISRDLENFRTLHQFRAIDLGIIVLREKESQSKIERYLSEYAKVLGIESVEEMDARIKQLAKAGVGNENLTPKNVKEAIAKSVSNGSPFHAAWAKAFTASKFGSTHSNFGILVDHVTRGGAGACPMLAVGIPMSMINRKPKAV